MAARARSERVKREGSSLSESGRVPWTRNYASPYLLLQRVCVQFSSNVSINQSFRFIRFLVPISRWKCYLRFKFHSHRSNLKGNEKTVLDKILKSVWSFVLGVYVCIKLSYRTYQNTVYRKKKYYFHRINSCLLDCSQQTTNLLRK